jgi:hypothetical protein
MATSKKSNKTSTGTSLMVIEQPVVIPSVEDVLNQVTEQLTTSTEVVATVETKLTKADIGRTIFNEELPNGLVRKTVIGRLIKEAQLTKAGAATYFQNMKKKAGLVKHTA